MANTTYTDLKAYILRKLGSPVINIEITDDQLEDCIDEAMVDFHSEHFNGIYTGYLPLVLETGVTKYNLGDNIQEVLRILSSDNLFFNWGADEPLLIQSYYYGHEGFHNMVYPHSLVDVEVYRQSVQMHLDYYDIAIQFDYNTATKNLYLHAEPEDDTNVFIKVYKSDDEDVAKYLKDKWVKSYSTALARLQWGTNLMKYEGVNLPGGAQFNYNGILQVAENDLERLREELEDKYSLPLDPSFG